jgi:NADH-quinone oxidoreductase subunit J
MNFPHVFMLAQSDAAITSAVLFWIFALMAGGAALGVAISRNIVRTAVFLLFTLTGVAGLYFLLNAEFLAAVQLVVYAGGTLILIVFGVMLTSKSPFSKFDPKIGEVMIAISMSFVLFAALVMAIRSQPKPPPQVETAGYPMAELGQILLGDFLVPFEIVSVLLLVVMIGAAYLAKGRRHESEGRETTAASAKMRQWS